MVQLANLSSDLPENFRCIRVKEVASGNYTADVVHESMSVLNEESLLIKVHYSSLNYVDAMSVLGDRRGNTTYPMTPGCDAAGIVISDTSGVFSAGDPVIVTGYDLGLTSHGGLSEYITVPSAWAIPLPDTLSLKESMIYGTAGLTAALCVDKLLRMGASPADGWVAVTGASGGVGSMSLSLLAKLGFPVAAVTGKLEASERLVSLGATKIVDIAQLEDDQFTPLSGGKWHHGIDCLGGQPLVSLLKTIHYGGSVVACGLSSSPMLKGSVYPFISRDVSLLGVDAVNQSARRKAQMWNRLSNDWKLPNLDFMAQPISLEQVPLYMTQMANGHAVGRYLVKT